MYVCNLVTTASGFRVIKMAIRSACSVVFTSINFAGWMFNFAFITQTSRRRGTLLCVYVCVAGNC